MYLLFFIVSEFREELEGPTVQVRRGHKVGAFSSFSAFAHAMTLIIAKHKKSTRDYRRLQDRRKGR